MGRQQIAHQAHEVAHVVGGDTFGDAGSDQAGTVGPHPQAIEGDSAVRAIGVVQLRKAGSDGCEEAYDVVGRPLALVDLHLAGTRRWAEGHLETGLDFTNRGDVDEAGVPDDRCPSEGPAPGIAG